MLQLIGHFDSQLPQVVTEGMGEGGRKEEKEGPREGERDGGRDRGREGEREGRYMYTYAVTRLFSLINIQKLLSAICAKG